MAGLPVSPLAPASIPALPPVPGVRLAAGAAGIRYGGRTDVMLAAFDEGTSIAGVLTRSLTAGAPVLWCRDNLAPDRGGSGRAIVVNSGNANVFTGRHGVEAVEATARETARLLGCAPEEVFVSSTGVIGEKLPVERLLAALPGIAGQLAPTGWAEAARAIMTTDTFPKLATATATIAGVPVRINGIAKGSGMIAPDMATMLGYLATDAAIGPAALQALLSETTRTSFNAITVDGDTSTSDTVLLAATGRAGHKIIDDPASSVLDEFRQALASVATDLAHQIVRDGEGAEKFIAIEVTGAVSADSARRIGLSIGNSPLVKTAIAAADANWGRIVMAVGKAGEPADRDRLSVAVGGVPIVISGEPVAGYDEAPVAAHMAGREISIAVDLGLGTGRAVVWTCDLTHRYIDINGSYRS